MPKLPRISSKKAIRALERLGFEQVRQTGSHSDLSTIGFFIRFFYRIFKKQVCRLERSKIVIQRLVSGYNICITKT